MKKVFLAFAISLIAGTASAAGGPGDWSGFYVGIQAGVAEQGITHCDDGFVPRCGGGGLDFPSYDNGGDLFGVTAGYNWQFNKIVAGVEADYAWADIDGSSPDTSDFGCGGGGTLCTSEISSIATIRGRLGYSFGRFLPYATAGVAFTRFEAAIMSGASGDKTTEADLVVGVGVEFAITQRLSVKAEYLHIDNGQHFRYDVEPLCGAPGCSTESDDTNLMRIGLNYRF